MKRAEHIRTEYRAHADMARGIMTWPRMTAARILAETEARRVARVSSVREFRARQRRRDAERERAARLAVCGLLPVVLSALVYFGGV